MHTAIKSAARNNRKPRTSRVHDLLALVAYVLVAAVIVFTAARSTAATRAHCAAHAAQIAGALPAPLAAAGQPATIR